MGTGFDRNTGVVDHGFAANTNLGLGLVAESGDVETLSQILQLPTANGPMQLSFSSEQLLTDSADLTVLLNGVVVGDVSVTSQTPATFQTLITDPSLENISNATLTFQVTDTANVNSATWVGPRQCLIDRRAGAGVGQSPRFGCGGRFHTPAPAGKLATAESKAAAQTTGRFARRS